MNVTLENTGTNTGIITVNVEPADYTEKVKNELKKFAATHVIPGFRKGHVPMNQLRQRFGKSVKSDVLNHLVYEEVIKYIRDNNVDILGEPLPESVEQIDLDDKEYTFKYEVGIKPALDIELNKEVVLPYYTIEVSDEMRAEQDKALRERMGAQVPGETVEDKAIVKGSIFELNEDGTVKETEDAIQVINGIVGPSFFKSKEEAAKFDGKHVNDKVVFNPYNSCEGNVAELSSMLNIDKDKAADVKGDFEMAIYEIIVLRPAEHDQEFFDNVFGKDKVHNEEEYTEELTKMIANSLSGNSEQLFAGMTQKYLLDKCADAQLPAEFLKKWLMARNEGLTKENIDKEYDQIKTSLLWQLIQNDVVKQLDVKVEESDLLGYAQAIAYRQFMQYGITNATEDIITAHAKQILANDEYRQRIADQVLESKMFAAIKDAVTLDDKHVTLDEFKKIANPAPAE